MAGGFYGGRTYAARYFGARYYGGDAGAEGDLIGSMSIVFTASGTLSFADGPVPAPVVVSSQGGGQVRQRVSRLADVVILPNGQVLYPRLQESVDRTDTPITSLAKTADQTSLVGALPIPLVVADPVTIARRAVDDLIANATLQAKRALEARRRQEEALLLMIIAEE